MFLNTIYIVKAKLQISSGFVPKKHSQKHSWFFCLKIQTNRILSRYIFYWYSFSYLAHIHTYWVKWVNRVFFNYLMAHNMDWKWIKFFSFARRYIQLGSCKGHHNHFRWTLYYLLKIFRIRSWRLPSKLQYNF